MVYEQCEKAAVEAETAPKNEASVTQQTANEAQDAATQAEQEFGTDSLEAESAAEKAKEAPGQAQQVAAGAREMAAAGGKSEDTSQKRVPVVLLFDEAQAMARADGFLIRVLRWILREVPLNRGPGEQQYDIVAVLAGTNSALANFYPEKVTVSESSRYLQKQKGNYYEEGSVPFPPFSCFRTTGCLSADPSFLEGDNEYERTIAYGRPLFAAMNKEGKLTEDAHLRIASKILLGKTTALESDLLHFYSVLATRIQMGPVSAISVSELVSKGYAHLTSFVQYPSQNDDMQVSTEATVSYLPDPVCARLAMCLMDDEFVLTGESGGEITSNEVRIKGQSKPFWSKMLARIQSSGFSRADEGNIGELAVALFLLFSSDVERKKLDNAYKTFSVDLADWLRNVSNEGRPRSNVDAGGRPKAEDSQWSENTSFKDGGEFTLNTIQFYRQILKTNLKDLGNPSFLRQLHSQACGIYTPRNSPAVDLLLPCQIATNGKTDYIPVFVSVKNWAYMSPKMATEFLAESLEKLSRGGVSRGLLLLCIIGQDRRVDNAKYTNRLGRKETLNTESITGNLTPEAREMVSMDLTDIQSKLVPRVVVIHDDSFGVHEAVLSARPLKQQQIADIYAMHPLLLKKEDSGWISHTSIGDLFGGYVNKATQGFYNDTLGCVEPNDEIVLSP